MITCTYHFLLLTTKHWWIWCPCSLPWPPCTEIGLSFKWSLSLSTIFSFWCNCQYTCRHIQQLKIHGGSANVSKVDILVMERAAWHILDLQLLSVVIFNKHVAHAHEGEAVYQFYLMEFALVTILDVTWRHITDYGSSGLSTCFPLNTELKHIHRMAMIQILQLPS